MGGSVADFPVEAPDGVAGWTKSEEAVYDRKTLYSYIDGGAELYISYGFSSVSSRTYTREGAPDIFLDIFDMGESKNAFGVFSHSRETIDETFGQGSQYTKGLLVFWKDRYYVSVLASPETDESKEAVLELGRRIEKAIPGEGALPDILKALPADSLVEESIRYFRHHVWLNSHYYVTGDNIFHIDENTEAVLAKYRAGDERWFLLVVEYPDESAALEAQASFVREYLPEAAGGTAVRIEDSTWVGHRRIGAVLGVVFNAPSEDTATRLLDEFEKMVE